jgi:prophage antirepressor-like protein
MTSLQKLSIPIEIYNFQSKQLRVVGTYEDPWFAVKDICDILGLSNTHQSLLNIPDKWKGVCKINTPSGPQDMSIVNEAGMYKQILRSNKPAAIPFQEWVCEDVLTSIRKKGEYVLQEYKEKLEEQQKQLEQKDLETKEQQKALKAKDEQIKKLQRETQVVNGKNVVYLCTTDEKEQEGVYTVGKTMNLKKRLDVYNNNKLYNFKIVKYISCKSSKLMDAIEQVILSKFNKYKSLSKRDVFQLPQGKDVSFFTQWYDYLNVCCEDIEDGITLEERTEEEKQELLDEKFEESKEDKSEYNKEYRLKHHEEILEREKNFREANKEQIREIQADYYINNLEKEAERHAIYREQHKEEISKKFKIYAKENAEKISKRKKAYNKNRKPHMEERIPCNCGAMVSRQNMTYHLGTDRHKNFINTGKTVDEQRIGAYVICPCGTSVSKKGLKRHQTSKLHLSYIESQSATGPVIE